MPSLFVYTEPNKAGVIPPRVRFQMACCFSRIRGVTSVSVSSVCSPTMTALPFTQTSIRLCDCLRCRLNAVTTMTPRSVFVPSRQNGTMERLSYLGTACVKGVTGSPSHLLADHLFNQHLSLHHQFKPAVSQPLSSGFSMTTVMEHVS